MKTEPDCDHNWLVTYTWLGRYSVALVCVRCHQLRRQPGRWWRRRGMTSAAHAYQADLAAARLSRLAP